MPPRQTVTPYISKAPTVAQIADVAEALVRRYLSQPSIPILTCHAMNVIRNNYAENEQLALVSDLETSSELGMKVIPLSQVVDWHQGLLADRGCIGLCGNHI